MLKHFAKFVAVERMAAVPGNLANFKLRIVNISDPFSAQDALASSLFNVWSADVIYAQYLLTRHTACFFRSSRVLCVMSVMAFPHAAPFQDRGADDFVGQSEPIKLDGITENWSDEISVKLCHLEEKPRKGFDAIKRCLAPPDEQPAPMQTDTSVGVRFATVTLRESSAK